ncbi:MAG: hypothetical protein NW223_22980 [Hyphomicrobiaceae bacterium]|nr:hypothetical protein [Hyphomicrobiaceae bacterium]
MWDITSIPTPELHAAIVSHLADNGVIQLTGPYRLTADAVSFYPDTLLCCLVVEPGTKILKGARAKNIEHLQTSTAFYFLFRATPGKQQIVPVADGPGNLLLANRHLDFSIENDQQRLEYTRFYLAFARSGQPPRFRHLPMSPEGLRFTAACPPEQRLRVQGALWRFMDRETRSRLAIGFQRRGIFHTLIHHHAHVPVQYGQEIYDVDINIWQRSGRITDTRYELVYANQCLAEEPAITIGVLPMPSYITKRERRTAWLNNIRAALAQVLYVCMMIVFLSASTVAVIFAAEGLAGTAAVRWILELIFGTSWWLILLLACAYCILHFAITTFLALDIESIHSAVLTLRPSWTGSWIDRWLDNKSQEQNERRNQNAVGGILARIKTAAGLLVSWLAYLILIFTSLQLSLRPYLLDENNSALIVSSIFFQQALQYIPMIFYFVGRHSLDDSKRRFVSVFVMLLFQSAVGLLVIRRIHRFWSDTSRAYRLRRFASSPTPAAP